MKVSYNLKNQFKRVHHIPSKRYKILIAIAVICAIVFIIIFGNYWLKLVKNEKIQHEHATIEKNDFQDKEEYFNKRQVLHLSKLGEILFLEKSYPKSRSKQFNILIWREGPFLERRHINFFTKKRHDPFETCSVNNCNITYDSDELENADAVLYYLQKFKSPEDVPRHRTRSSAQRWIFLSDQSPFNTFQRREENDWRNYSNIFNWSMTYKIESDIPIPYGRTISKLRDYTGTTTIKKMIPHMNRKRRDVLVAIKPTDCTTSKKRMIYVTELQKYIDVDVYGKCATNPDDLCSPLSDSDCGKLDTYLFYLSFENSNCDQFMTESLYWIAYSKGAIPIIMGPTIQNCEALLPPDSFLHVDNFTEPSDLANYVLHLNDTRNDSYMKYHEWRKSFRVVNEHGYHGTPSKYYCRICEALNYNDVAPKVYTNLSRFLSVEDNCRN